MTPAESLRALPTLAGSNPQGKSLKGAVSMDVVVVVVDGG